MRNGPFEDVFPVEHGDSPASYVSLPEGISNAMNYLRNLRCRTLESPN